MSTAPALTATVDLKGGTGSASATARDGTTVGALALVNAAGSAVIGGGPHFCLGTSLARQELSVLFRELFDRLPEIRSVGEPELVPSSFDNRVGRLRFTVGEGNSS